MTWGILVGVPYAVCSEESETVDYGVVIRGGLKVFNEVD